MAPRRSLDRQLGAASMLAAVLLGCPIGPAGAQPSAASPAVDPWTIARAARVAVEGDSAPALAAHWAAALARDSGDRGAALGLAVLAEQTYHHDDAQRRFAALSGGPGRPRDAVTTVALLRAAWDLYDQGYSSRADTLFTHARAEARARHDALAEADALAGVALIRASQLGAPLGIALLDTARRIYPGGNPELEALIAYRRALLAVVQQLPGSAGDALAAAALARRAAAPRIEALALRALALGQKLREHFDSSLQTLGRAEALERASHDRLELSVTLARHADILHDRGDLGAFRTYALMARAEALASGSMYVAAATDVALGVIAIQLHDDATAATFLHQAGALNVAMDDQGGIASVQAFEALRAADVGDFATARQLAESARAFRRAIRDPEEFEIGRDLVYIDIESGDLAAAGAALAQAESAAARYHLLATTSFDRERGRLALARGDVAAAVAALTRAERRADSSEHVLRHGVRVLLAVAYARGGDLRRAASELASAEDELDAWRAALTDSALRPFVFQVSSREATDRELTGAEVLAAMVRGGLAPEAFELAERRRARELADRLLRLDALGARPPGSGADTGARRAAALTSRRVSADSVARWLPAGTALLELVSGPRGTPTTLFAIPSQHGGAGAAAADAAGAARGTAGRAGTPAVLAFELPSADSLGAEVARLAALIESGLDIGPLARRLGRTLLDSALAALGPGVTRLIIVPDGPLHRLAFDALEDSAGAPIATRYAVSIAPSAAVWDALVRRGATARASRAAGGRDTPRMLVLADPRFPPATPATPATPGDGIGGGATGATGAGTIQMSSREDGATERGDVYRGAFALAGGLPRLAASAREARVVAAFAPGADVRLRRAASAAYFRHAPLAGYRIIHIATHALVDERSLARTALVLAPGDGETGFVPASELTGLRLRADLVVLSACQTAGGAVIDGEGVQGLTGPLLAAGARAVVATQWRIRDQAVLPVVEDFYAALARGLPVGDALAAAKQAAIRRGAPPAEWAAFTIVGDPFPRISLEQPGALRLAEARLGAPGSIAAALLVLALAAALALGGAVAVRWRPRETRSASRGHQRNGVIGWSREQHRRAWDDGAGVGASQRGVP